MNLTIAKAKQALQSGVRETIAPTSRELKEWKVRVHLRDGGLAVSMERKVALKRGATFVTGTFAQSVVVRQLAAKGTLPALRRAGRQIGRSVRNSYAEAR